MNLPRLKPTSAPFTLYLEFLNHLKHSTFAGEISEEFADRLSLATDNSVYQLLPQAVVFPKDVEDLKIFFRLFAKPEFQSLKVTPRGGGTGTNGQSLNTGIMLDLSRHQNQILEVNTQEGWVRVQPGVVLDQLNEHLKPFGFFFAPTLSTSSRATLGGMINTDACGKGSRLYGKTSNHILELTSLLVDGEQLHTQEMDLTKLAELKAQGGRFGQIYQEVDRILTENQAAIEQDIPQLDRFVTGYNLTRIYTPDRSRFNLNYLLSGSEGTLAVIAEAKLKLTPLVKHKQLLLVKYDNFQNGLQDAQKLVAADPAAIETIDEKILSLAREDEIIHKIAHMIEEHQGHPTKAINLVEFVGDDAHQVSAKVQGLIAAIEQGQTAAFGYYLATDPKEIADLWELRKKGVGLLGNAKGKRRPIAFVEDSVVPPEHLADYIADFRSLMDSYGLEYGMFGHVDVGCLHVRPALDLKDSRDQELMIRLSDQVAGLVHKYGGVIWGEHGKGFRSQYTEKYFGPHLYQELRKIKGLFDPHNQLNPGKIATPYGSSDPLVQVDGPFRGYRDRQMKPELLQAFEGSVNCNGNGACFNYSPHSVICPSFHVTQDRKHSPKGRSALMREWLTQMSLAQARLSWKTSWSTRLNPFHWGAKLIHTLGKKVGVEDYSHQVLEAFQGCLSCKACQSQCPIKVDVSDFKSKFYAIYYQRYLRHPRDYFAAVLEKSAQTQQEWHELFNQILGWRITRFGIKHLVGIVDPPCLSSTNLRQGLIERGLDLVVAGQNLSHLDPKKSVLLVQDAFTSFYETDLILKLADLLATLDVQLYVLPFYENGKASHVKGFLDRFEKIAAKTTAELEAFGKFGIPMIGLEPATTLTYRDEYPAILGRQRLGVEVKLLQEYLLEVLARTTAPQPKKALKVPFFGHCTERTANPKTDSQWQKIFAAFGHELQPQTVGCCGMCGIFGHEKEHYEQSKTLYQQSWQPMIQKAQSQGLKPTTTGYSCRSQVKRLEGFKPQHPIEALLEGLGHEN